MTNRMTRRAKGLRAAAPPELRRWLSPDRGAADHPTFVRGLMLGALVGAAIAGSTIWTRFLARRSGTSRDN